jgi:hypothetical protein
MGGSSMCSEACGSASLNPIENRGLCGGTERRLHPAPLVDVGVDEVGMDEFAAAWGTG